MPQLSELFDRTFLQRLESLRLHCRKPRWGSHAGGSFTINKRGSSVEFADYREYTWGDDFRNIDWNLYGRLEKLFVKTFKEDIELNVHIIIDATASMGVPADSPKFQYVKDVALALAYVGLCNHSLVRVTAFGGNERRLDFTPYFQHRHGIFRIHEFLERQRPEGDVSFASWVERYLHAAHASGGTVILISDWMMDPKDWVRGFQLCEFNNLDVKVLQVLTPEELKPGKGWSKGYVVDVETGARRTLWDMKTLMRALEEHNAQLAAFCQRNGLFYAHVSTGLSVELFILRELPRLGLII